MAVEIITCEQGTPEWYAARLGTPTASCFKDVLAKGEGKTRTTYMRKLAGEIITGKQAENYVSADMLRGHEMEEEARQRYAFEHEVEPLKVGFVRNGAKGWSPDSLIGSMGALEIKTKAPHILIEVIEKGVVPSEHVAQLQGGLWVGERDWIDFVAYWPGFRPFVKKVYRDEAYIRTLASAVDLFNDELAAMVERIRAYGAPREAA